MEAIGYNCAIRLIPTYIPSAKEIRLFVRFHPDSFKTKRLVCVETDNRCWLDQHSSDADQEYLYFMGSETSPSLGCKLLTLCKIIIFIQLAKLKTIGFIGFPLSCPPQNHFRENLLF